VATERDQTSPTVGVLIPSPPSEFRDPISDVIKALLG
jgi:hypothetical protein